MKRRVTLAACALVMFVLALAFAATQEAARGERALEEARVALQAREVPRAIAAAKVAAEARVPFTDHADEALALLASIAEEDAHSESPKPTSRLARTAEKQARDTTLSPFERPAQARGPLAGGLTAMATLALLLTLGAASFATTRGRRWRISAALGLCGLLLWAFVRVLA